jgi:hypothetical protein
MSDNLLKSLFFIGIDIKEIARSIIMFWWNMVIKKKIVLGVKRVLKYRMSTMKRPDFIVVIFKVF